MSDGNINGPKHWGERAAEPFFHLEVMLKHYCWLDWGTLSGVLSFRKSLSSKGG
jgi:hypothetical protein